ncbi:MFS transporter [Alicyclobacillus mali (ex Roth et al. 2021)]|uniref:MFS transporter n=1 Tax=Alicyclobacillus mali (ex Roth et al. 2021) TaxID=1123961 RepID=UPI001A8D12F8|nr:MFS transporter [Alicyclobacillus mali (ex Roth et al. 2021)]
MANFRDVNLLTRLDRLPITPRVVGIIALLSLVWLAEAFDIGIVGPVLTTLEKAWHLTTWQTGLLAIASTIGIVIGMIPAGMMADRFGRRRVILMGIAWFSVVTMLGALTRNVADLFLVRLVAGIGEGAVLPMPYLILSEFTNHRRRAVSVGYANGILTAAYVVPSLVSVWALHHYAQDVAWRVPFLLGGVPLLMLIPIALWLPESPRFLLDRGRQAPVAQLVESLEQEAALPHDESLYDEVIAETLDETPHDMLRTLRAIFRPPLLARSAVVILHLTAALILFYILQVFGPALLAKRGLGVSNSILDTGLMMLLAGFGSVCQGYLSDRFGRKRVLAVYAALATAGCLIFAWVQTRDATLVAGFLTAFFGLGIFPVSKLSVAEQYPTEVRGRGVYVAEMIARGMSGIVTTYFIPFVLSVGGDHVVFLGIGVVLVAFTVPFVAFGRETAQLQLEYATSVLPLKQVRPRLSRH